VSRHIGHAESRKRQAQGTGISHASALISTVSSGERPRASRAPLRGPPIAPKKRLRHWLTTSRRVSRRAPISSLAMPSAAIRIILARTTSKYGNVYLAARRVSSAYSFADNSIQNGLFLGICNSSSKGSRKMPYVAELIKHIRGRIYESAY
jgi:hypothetical protein